MKSAFFLAVVGAALALPSAAFAQQQPQGSSNAVVTNAAADPMGATLVCRVAQGSEKSNAMMGTTGMMCQKIDLVAMRADMAKMMGGTETPAQKAQADTLYKNYLLVTGRASQ
jgi:hypothetical protein